MVICMLALLAQDFDPIGPEGAPRYEGSRITARVRWWRPELRGRGTPDKVFGTTSCEPKGPAWSYEQNTGLDKKEAIPMLEVAFRNWVDDGRRVIQSGVNFIYWEGEWSASEILGEAIDLGVTILPSGTPMESKLDMSRWGAEIYGISEIPGLRSFRLGGSAGIHVLRIKYQVHTPMGKIEDVAKAGPFSVGLRMEWQPTEAPAFLTAGVRASYLLGTFTDAWFGAEVYSGPVEIQAGWHGTWYPRHGDFEVLRLALKGPFLGVSVRF